MFEAVGALGILFAVVWGVIALWFRIKQFTQGEIETENVEFHPYYLKQLAENEGLDLSLLRRWYRKKRLIIKDTRFYISTRNAGEVLFYSDEGWQSGYSREYLLSQMESA